MARARFRVKVIVIRVIIIRRRAEWTDIALLKRNGSAEHDYIRVWATCGVRVRVRVRVIGREGRV